MDAIFQKSVLINLLITGYLTAGTMLLPGTEYKFSHTKCRKMMLSQSYTVQEKVKCLTIMLPGMQECSIHCAGKEHNFMITFFS